MSDANAAKVHFKRLALIGIGLIGSSVARAVQRHRLADEIVCADINAGHRAKAVEIGLVSQAYEDPREAVNGADLIVLCSPVGSYKALAEAISGALKPGAILTDVGSVKGAVEAAVRPFVPEGVHFIPGHPVAGTEQSGPEAGFADLFENRWCILTPAKDVDSDALQKLSGFWKALGANVEVMDATHHDLVLAITSHVPHLIAYNIVGTAADLEEVTQSEVIKYSAGGFRDFTRIAASDPTMWRDVFLNNREAVLETLGRFVEDLTALQRAIRWGDADTLMELFTRTRAIRRSIVEAGQESPAPDFGRKHGQT